MPENLLTQLVVEVVDQLDLGELTRQLARRDSAAHHPAVMLSLMAYGYASRVLTGRKIERATYDSVAFRYVAANTHLDHNILDTFRQRFISQLENMCVQALLLR